ncbi:FAD-dependent oxidoreductase [Thalassotalea profundi]|uniref:Kynurenine 3-monooxygenase n=1 Tax=Thalassotalea profundi TaxID=2036687 RepID=A0ABQ3ISJ0_9GAMM|nr:NAD(P)/FAD-dependent oxidoreductase [Thalassotalea profundi]GHE89937.1 kynurenine 3-monooxygenase [Thalassotalea profundi]
MATTKQDLGAKEKELIAIVGAGPVGALLALKLAKKGYKIDLFESRPDSRKTDIYQGKSINLALSDRGWRALQAVGIEQEIRQQAIPMYCRVMHDIDGNLTKQAYGTENQAIWSVSRSGINEQLITQAEKCPLIDINFSYRLTQLNFDDNTAVYLDENQQVVTRQSDIIFGADGAFSKVRRLMQELPKQRISYSLDYMPQSYIELTIAANEDGSHKLEKNALHIWPRKDFMLIALPNLDGSFTCTLFMNQEGDLSFNSLNSYQKVATFFQRYFADAMLLLENPVEDFLVKSASPLCLVHIYPWLVNEQVALIGDAAHAMVPFYGQGMNSGFEDCRVLSELVDENKGNWQAILQAYQHSRKVNCDAITELAQRNFVEMSDLAGDANFLLRKKIEAHFHQKHPKLWVPLYSMVTFSPDIPYSKALAIGDIQKNIMDEIMKMPGIEKNWQGDEVYNRMYQLASSKLELNL